MQEISWKTYKLYEADSRPKLTRKLCVRVLNSRTATQKFQPVFMEIFRMTPCMFLYIKRQINNQRIVCYNQKSANQTANSCFCSKIRTPYGSIRDSEQLRRDTIWGYPEYGASNCVHHMVSPGLDGLNKRISKFNTAVYPLCSLCSPELEDVLHLFCHCPKTQNLWESLRERLSPQFSLPELTPTLSILGNWKNENTYNIILNHITIIFKNLSMTTEPTC